MIKLNSNETPWDMPSDVKARIAEAVAFNRYPSESDERSLIVSIARYLRVEPESVILTNGGDEAILLITMISQGPVVFSDPGFDVPERVARALGRETIPLPPEEIPEARGGLGWLISPHNPMGFLYEYGEIAKASENYGVLAVDCAYWEFSEARPEFELAEGRNNTVFLGTFSKAWGLAGLRLGYIVAPAAMAGPLRAARLDYPVNGLAIRAALWALDNEEIIKERVELIVQEREKLKGFLAGLGLRVCDTRTNFVSFWGPRGLGEALRNKGVLIRQYDRPPGFYRVTVGTPEENSVFAETLKEVLG